MRDTIVSVENVSKKYCKNLKRSLLYGLSDIARELTGKSLETDTLRRDEFWALKDVSFELKRGESLGIIGRNGAGKTTLLKMINGLIKPTKGKITIRGKVGALIALGTGFNPVLTGRENIKIAGVVLGFSSREMDEKLEEIVEFSDIGDFIDAPVKSYSSGMLVRLGFAVAIQLQPDLLLVDEVLAVGDLRFAVKCHKKITEYQNSGGSLILVSHGLHNIRFHCDRAIWLHGGKIKKMGLSHEVCNAYERYTSKEEVEIGEIIYFDHAIRIEDVEYPEKMESGQNFTFEFGLHSERVIENLVMVFAIRDVKGELLIRDYSHFRGFSCNIPQGYTRLRIEIDKLPLASGIYGLTLNLFEGRVNNHLVVCNNSFRLEVSGGEDTFGIFQVETTWSLVMYDGKKEQK